MGDTRFLAEVFQRSEWPPELASAACPAVDQRGMNISLISCARPDTDTYWNEWGGTYDNPTTTNLQIFFSDFLQQVSDINTLILTVGSFYVSGEDVFLNTDYYPWQYIPEDTEVNVSFGYSSAPVDPRNPSNEFVSDEDGGKQRFPVRLKIPSITNKLSDPISGTALYSTFDFSLFNNNGSFDLTENTNFFNTPVFIRKSVVKNPKKEDYTTVRYGLVDNITVGEETIRITAEDLFRTLDEEVCRTINRDDYPEAPDSSLGKEIPIAYGPFAGMDLIEVGEFKYLACDPDYLLEVTAVYNGDGKSLSFTCENGVITTAEKAESCDFSALADYNIGSIITKEMAEKSNLTYTEGIWDKTETDSYIDLARKIFLYFDGGTVKELVKACLESDNAFLISKNDGRLTLRQWGQIYTTHEIPSYLFTKFPKKTFTDRKYYASTIKILYGYNEADDEYELAYIDDSKENYLNEKYRKSKTYEFETRLTSEESAKDLASRLLNRFGGRKEIFTIASGYDTSAINLLDTVQLKIDVNDRVMSDVKLWTVKEVNVTQDVLKLEESDLTFHLFSDGLLAEAGSDEFDGLLSEATGLLASIPKALEEE